MFDTPSSRILAVDPGDKRIGIAVSDPSGTLARPLTVINHRARQVDAAVIAEIAAENSAVLIVVGEPLDDEGNPTPQSRKAVRLAEAIRRQTETPVILWDESGSTQEARETSILLGKSRKRRRGHQDDLAAAMILQSYLDSNQRHTEQPKAKHD